MGQIIAETDGVSKIEALQQHETESIYNKAVKVLFRNGYYLLSVSSSSLSLSLFF